MVDDADTGAGEGSDVTSVDDRSETDEDVDAVTAALPGDVRREHLVRAGHVLGVLVLVAVVVPFVLYAVPQLIGAEYSYVVTSGSMAPTLQAYDVVFVDAVEPGVVEQGDIINFDRPSDERTTTHRVIEVVESDSQPAFRTAGDNNEKPDNEIVTAEQLRGRVMHAGDTAIAIPYVGRIVGFASGQFGFVLLFVVPVTLLIANEVYNFVATADSAEPASATDGGSGPEPGPEPGNTVSGTVEQAAVTDEREADGVSFSPAELKLGTAILGAFLVYSAWMAVSDPGAVTIGVAGSVTVALFMLGGLYWQGTTESQPTGPRQSVPEPAAEGVFIRTAPMDARSAANRESVDTLETLIETSEAIGRAIYRTPDGSAYYLPTGATAYVYEAGSTARETTEASDAWPAEASAGEGAAEGDEAQANTDEGDAEEDEAQADTDEGDAAGRDEAEANTDEGPPPEKDDAGERADERASAESDDVDGEGQADDETVPLADEPMSVAGSSDDCAAEAAEEQREQPEEQREQTDGEPGGQDSGVDTASGAEDDASATVSPDSNMEADDD